MPPSYHEIDPSPINGEWYEHPDGRHGLQFRAERLLVCAWTDRASMISWLYSESAGGYPHADGTTAAIVRKVKPESRGIIGGVATLASYDECILRVYYDTWGPRWVNSVYMDESILPHQIYVCPPEGLLWSDGEPITPAEAHFRMPVLGALHVVSVSRATTAPSNPFSNIGTVNAAGKNCYILPYSYAAGTGLYSPPFVMSHTDYELGTRYSYTYKVVINPFGWNKFWRAATGLWETAYDEDGNAYVQYPAGAW
jgi:hypothetical protein